MGQRVESTIDRVTVFPGAAWVTRTARIAVSARTELALVGLPAALDDDSVQIAVRGPARAADVRITLAVTGSGDPGATDDAELHARRRDLAAVNVELTSARHQLESLGELSARARGERDETRPAWADALGARLALIELQAAREPALRAEIATIERRLDVARQALHAAELRRSQATSAQLPPGAVRKTLEVTVEPEGAGGDVTVVASYLVPGASWAPSYVVRLGDGDLRLELRASIAQATGEDWTGVAVEVSTARPQRWVELPELPSLRIGRSQPTPARAGWRPPPPDVDALFADWDRAFGSRRGQGVPATIAVPEPEPTTIFDLEQEEVTMPYALDEPDGVMRRRAEPPSPPPPMQAAQMQTGSMPMPLPAARKSGGLFAGLGGLVGGSGGAARAPAPKAMTFMTRGSADRRLARGARDDEEREREVELAVQVDLLAYAHLRMRGPREDGRGKLQRLGRTEIWRTDARVALAVGAAVARARQVAGLAAPSGCSAAAPGVYDHAFTADARLDVPADGTWHNVALLARPGKVAVRHVAVPAVAPEVYRVAAFTNPLDAPMLPGPVDVYDRGELVVTGAVEETAPGGMVELGLGVDAAVKTARNARFREEAAGMLRGTLKLVHEITIAVENLGPRPVQLEVRERLPRPAPDEEDVEVHVDRVAPAWEPWKPDAASSQAELEGGHRWRIELAPAGKRDLQLDYHVKIAGKHELVGGNRREP